MNSQIRLTIFVIVVSLLITTAIGSLPQPSQHEPSPDAFQQLSADVYKDKLYGAWQATMVANHTGLIHEGIYLEEPSDENTIELALLDEWSTDDDTSVEWVYMHTLETYGLNPTYVQIRDEWVEHLNHDIWVAALRARELMAEGIVPPETSNPLRNDMAPWSIGAQLQTELFGLIAPGQPDAASRRAKFFARVTNRGPAVEASEFYAIMYALAFFETEASSVPTLIDQAYDRLPDRLIVREMVDDVRTWHSQHPDDWRATRRLIRDKYDDDPMWWASRVNFASTIMALLYGEGDFMQTQIIANLAGWDADNNATSAAGLLGIISGFDRLPADVRNSTDVYYNEDVTGDLPKYTTVMDFAERTQRLGEAQILSVGGHVVDGMYWIPK